MATMEGGGFGRITEMVVGEVERRGCVGEWWPGDLLECYRCVRGRGWEVEKCLSRLVRRVYGREFMALHGYRVYRKGRSEGKEVGGSIAGLSRAVEVKV